MFCFLNLVLSIKRNWRLIFVRGPVPDKTRSEQADQFVDTSSFIMRRGFEFFNVTATGLFQVCVMLCDGMQDVCVCVCACVCVCVLPQQDFFIHSL